MRDAKVISKPAPGMPCPSFCKYVLHRCDNAGVPRTAAYNYQQMSMRVPERQESYKDSAVMQDPRRELKSMASPPATGLSTAPLPHQVAAHPAGLPPPLALPHYATRPPPAPRLLLLLLARPLLQAAR
jgi:hypothetical protein